jgi:hypothetical protein
MRLTAEAVELKRAARPLPSCDVADIQSVLTDIERQQAPSAKELLALKKCLASADELRTFLQKTELKVDAL